MRRTSIAILLLVAACSPSIDASDVPELPTVDTEATVELLTVSTKPVVVNVWAAWCAPCRSEAPLLAGAASEYGDRISFVGLNVRDSQDDARRFIAEFYAGVPIGHVYDRDGFVPVDLGGSRAVPLTYFYRAGGELLELHNGIIDERTLALHIDELLEG